MLRDLWIIIKPRQTLLLLIAMIGGFFAAKGCFYPLRLVPALASGFLAIAGTTAMNMVLDRDIDAAMNRTKSRPLASNSLSPYTASLFSALTFSLGVLLALLVNVWFALTVLLGYFFDILVYTNIAKRRTVFNILLGGVAGGMPAVGGWAAAAGSIGLEAVLLGLLVMAWIPMHIWFIASYYLDDYRRAGIPMAPVVWGAERAGFLIQVSLLLMAGLAWGFYLTTGYGLIASILESILGGIAFYKTWLFRRKPSRELALSMFKYASPMLAVFFIAVSVEACLAIV